MQIQKIDLSEYREHYVNMKGKNIYVSPEYLKCLKEIREVGLYKIESEKEVAGIFPVLERKKIFVKYSPQPPFTQFFNLLINNRMRNERKEMDYLDRVISSYMAFLKKSFLLYLIPQHYYLTDLRPFIWDKAKVRILFTYLFRIEDNELKQIDRRIRNKESLNTKRITDYRSVFSGIYNAYKGKPPLKQLEFNKFISALNENQLIECFKNDNAQVCFLKDINNNIVYEFLIAGRDSGRLILDVFEQGFYKGMTFDFQGANTKRIAKYKALFNPELKQYFAISRFI